MSLDIRDKNGKSINVSFHPPMDGKYLMLVVDDKFIEIPLQEFGAAVQYFLTNHQGPLPKEIIETLDGIAFLFKARAVQELPLLPRDRKENES